MRKPPKKPYERGVWGNPRLVPAFFRRRPASFPSQFELLLLSGFSVRGTLGITGVHAPQVAAAGRIVRTESEDSCTSASWRVYASVLIDSSTGQINGEPFGDGA